MIETTRCELTTLQRSDLSLVMKLYTNSEVRRFLGGVVDLRVIRLKFLQMLKSDLKRQH